MIQTTSDRPRRKRRRRTIGCLSLYALIAAGLAFLILAPGPTFERDGTHVDFVERKVAIDADTAHARLADGLNAALQVTTDFAGSNVHSFESNAFPTRSQMVPKADENVALKRYAQLEEGAWSGDFYVTGPYKDWFSEYMHEGKRLPFNTNFFIHLESIGENEIRIEVIEYFARVDAGRTFRLCTRHGGPMFVRDKQEVAPTTRDRREMLDLAIHVVERAPPPR